MSNRLEHIEDVVTLENWAEFAAKVSYPGHPDDLNEAAVARLMDALGGYAYVAKNVRPQFKARNRIQLIDFLTAEDRKSYALAWEEFQEKKRKLEGDGAANYRHQILLELLIFKMKAELLKAPVLAREMYLARQNGFAPICAVNYKQTIAKVVQILIEDYNVSRDDISLIWGGDKRFDMRDDERLSQKEITSYLISVAQDMNKYDKRKHKKIQMQMEADVAGLSNLPKEWRLGAQSSKQRQDEIDRFQADKSTYCFFTFKSGGVGLSLHHSDDLTKEKVRRKPGSGYAYVEDIPRIPILPRKVFVTPTYSAMELVQGLGRGARITSLSDTEQIITFFINTIETHVAMKVSQRLKCLRSAVRAKERWDLDDAIWDGDTSSLGRDTKLIESPSDAIAEPDEEESSVLYGDLDTTEDEEDNDN